MSDSNRGPWLNEWPAELPDGSLWEWESDRWRNDRQMQRCRLRADVCGMLHGVGNSRKYTAGFAYHNIDFDPGDRIRRVYEPAHVPGEDELADARDNLCELLGLSTSGGDEDLFAAAVERIRALEATMQLGAIQMAALERVDEMDHAQRGEGDE